MLDVTMLPQARRTCRSDTSCVASRESSVEQPCPLSKVVSFYRSDPQEEKESLNQISRFPSVAVLQLHQLFQCSSDQFPLSETEKHITCCTIGDGGNTVQLHTIYSKDHYRDRRCENPRDSNELRILVTIVHLPTSTCYCSLSRSFASLVTTEPLQPWTSRETRVT